MESVPTEGISQSPVRVLIVEDETPLRTALHDYFTSTRYTTTVVDDADSSLRHLTGTPKYDVALLDLGLPGRSGFDVLEEANRRAIDTSFLIISGRCGLNDRLRGFELGAEDYIVKPFDVEELEARIKAILTRRLAPAADPADVYATDDLTINFGSNTCYYRGERVALTRLECNILEYLVKKRGTVVSRDELRNALWDEPDAISLRTIDRHVAKIRSKLEDNPNRPRYLQTVYEKGYEFVSPTSFDPVQYYG